MGRRDRHHPEREAGFNLGGIVLTADRSAFVVAQGNVGQLWRFSTRTATVGPVDTGGADLVNADGLVRQGNRLTVVRNFSKMIATLRLTHDGHRALLLDQTGQLRRPRPHHRQDAARPDPVRRQQVRRGRRVRPVRGHHGPDPMKRVVLAALPLALVLAGCGGGDPTTSPEPSPDSGRSSSPSTPAESASGTPDSAKAPAVKKIAALNRRLRDAAWANDVARARRLIRQGADVNAKDDTEQSAYLIATSEGYLDLLRLTLRAGARINDKDSWNGTGLIRAAERGHGLVVGDLLQAGIDRDHVNRIGYQAIHEAVWLGEDTASYATTVRVLAAGGVRLTDRSPSSRPDPAGDGPRARVRRTGEDPDERDHRRSPD